MISLLELLEVILFFHVHTIMSSAESNYNFDVDTDLVPCGHKVACRIWDDTPNCRTPRDVNGDFFTHVQSCETRRNTLESLGELLDYIVNNTQSPWISGSFDPLWATYSIAKSFSRRRAVNAPDTYYLSTFHVNIVPFGTEAPGDGVDLRDEDFGGIGFLDDVTAAHKMVRAQSQVLIYGQIYNSQILEESVWTRSTPGRDMPEIFRWDYRGSRDGLWYENLVCDVSKPYRTFRDAVVYNKIQLDRGFYPTIARTWGEDIDSDSSEDFAGYHSGRSSPESHNGRCSECGWNCSCWDHGGMSDYDNGFASHSDVDGLCRRISAVRLLEEHGWGPVDQAPRWPNEDASRGW